jgi:hypothetical protein
MIKKLLQPKKSTLYILLVGVLCIVSFLYVKTHDAYASSTGNAINGTFYVGTNTHAEDIYLKADPATMVQPLTAGSRTLADYDRWLQTASASGMTMVRSAITFDSIATSSADQSTWNWTDMDRWINKVTSAGLEPLVLVVYGAPWLADPLDATATSGAKLEFAVEFGKYAGALAARYGDRVKYYEVWNEPSLSTFYMWGREDFTRILVEASYQIKLNDADAKVMYDVHALDSLVNPSLSFGGQGGFSAQMLNYTISRSDGQSIQGIDAVDIIAGHSYPDRTSDIPEDMLSGRFQMAHFYNYLQAFLRNRYGATRGEKKFFHTETGWSSRATSLTSRWVSEAKAATLLVRSAVNLMTTPNMQSFIQYDISDDGADTDEYEQNYGITFYAPDNDGNLVAKQGLTAMATMSDVLAGTNFVSTTSATLTSDTKNWTYQFANPTSGRKVWAVVLANALTPLGSLNTTTTSTVDLAPTTSNVTIRQLDGTTSNATVTNGSVTVVTSENMQFIMEPPTISSLQESPTTTGATITWTTNEAASTIVDYGLTSSYGSSTTETDTAGVTSHSVTLTGLASCTTYHYRVRSQHASEAESLGTDGTFTTTGCTGSAAITDETRGAITTASGGTVSLQDSGTGIELTIPASFAGANAEFQIKQLNKASVLATTSTPTGYSAIGDYVYDLKALSSPTTSISSFNNPLTIEISYSTADITGIDESTLKIYRWDGSSWNQLSGCAVNITTSTVSCTTTAFSVFTLFGQATVSSSTSSNSSSSSSSSSTTQAPTCSATSPGNKVPWLYGAIPKGPNSIELYFTENSDPVTHYALEYGIKPGEYTYAVSDIGKKGLRTYIVSALQANSPYYFRVRAGNGCATGGWSNEIKAKTTNNLTTTFLDITSSELSTVKNVEEEKKEKRTTVSFDPTPQPSPVPTLTEVQEQVTKKSGYDVTVVVVNKQKEPIQGADVTLHSTPKYATTNKDGIATFSNVEKGAHRVIIAYNNFEGEQSINLQGEVQEFKLNVEVEEKVVLLTPFSIGVIVLLTLIILVLGIFIIRLRNKKASSFTPTVAI